MRTSAKGEDWAVKQRHAAGSDVPAAVPFVAVPAPDVPAGFVNPQAKLPAGVRQFGTTTGDREAWAAGRKDCPVQTVAMASTGVFGMPRFDRLASPGFAGIRVEPRPTPHAPGRPPRDVLDCPWMRRRHRYGLRTAALRPADASGRWRGFPRPREMRLRSAAPPVQHLPQVREEMQGKRTAVGRASVGQTGRKISRDMVREEREPRPLAKQRHALGPATEAASARALSGTWRPEHRFALQPALQLEEFDPKQVRAGDTQIAACRRGRADQSPGKALPTSRRRRQPEKKEVRCGAGALRFRRAGVALTVIEGIRATTARGIVRAVGVDRSKFPHEQNFVSWLGLCPQHRGSVGQICQRRMRRGAKRAARALRMAAPGGHPATKARGAFDRRSPARGGGAQAVGATARKRAERGYRWLRYGPA